MSDSGAHNDRAPRIVRPQQIGLEYDWPACCSAMYLDVLLEGLKVEVRVAPSHGEIRGSCVDARLKADGSTLTVSDGASINDLCGGAQEVDRGGVFRHPAAKGLRV